MYEIIPVVVGILMALLVPRFVGAERRLPVYAVLSVVTAILVTFVAGEEWFFVFIDLAEVVLALVAALWVKSRLSMGARRERVEA